MVCWKCAAELRKKEGYLVCTRCKAAYTTEFAGGKETLTEYIEPRGFSSKKHFWFIGLGVVFAIIIAIAGITTGISVSHSHSVSKGFEIAERYLSELNYERAVIEFQNILEIEPMNVEAYLGLAKAYVGMGKTNKAIKTLKEGYRLTGDERLQDMIDELERADEPPASSSTEGNSTSLSRSSEPIDSFEPIEPVEVEPVYGSMGFVTIAGKEYDIATTKSLTINGLLSNRYPTDEDVVLASQLVNLTQLTLVWGTISDISQLSNLTNLTELKLGGNSITDITPLANLTNLTELSLGYNQISDISPLVNLTNLDYLYLHSNEISDISPLASLTNLTKLDLQENQIIDIMSIANLTNLSELRLYDNIISDITPISNLANLTYLYLNDNEISDIMPISNLTNLTYLCLNDNKISDISPLVNLTNLKTLRLSSNEIGDVTPLMNCTALKNLYITNNQIYDLSPLAKIPSLRKLEIYHNPITDITPLAENSKFNWLYLPKNSGTAEERQFLRKQLPKCDIFYYYD